MLKKYRNLPRDVYILCFGIFLTNLGSYVYPLFVFLAADYGFTYAQSSAILSSFVIATIFGQFISGHLVDLWGRRQTFTIFMFLSGLMFALLPFAGKYSFVAMVILANVFSGISRPAARVMLVDLTTQDQRKEALSLWYIMLNVGFSFGPAVGAYLYTINVNILYLGDGLTTMLFAFLIMLFVKETKPTQHQIDTHDVAGERKMDGSAFRVIRQKPELLYLMIFSALFTVPFCQFNFGLPTTTDMVKGEITGPIVFAIMMTINGITVTVITPLITKFMEKRDASIGLVISGFAMALGCAMYGFIKADWLFYAAAFIWSCGEAMWVVNYIAYETNHTPINHRGRISTLMRNVASGARMVTLYASGILIEHVSLLAFWLIVPAFALAASAVAFKLHQYNLPKTVRNA